jgi:hypothetical protein
MTSVLTKPFSCLSGRSLPSAPRGALAYTWTTALPGWPASRFATRTETVTGSFGVIRDDDRAGSP